MGRVIAGSLALLALFASGYAVKMKERAAFWKPKFADIGESAGTGPIKSINSQLALCGFQPCEVVTVETITADGRDMTITMQLHRNGSKRLELITHEVFWLDPTKDHGE